MTDDPNKPQRIPPSLVTPVRNLKWTYQREDEGKWSIWAGDGGFVAEMVCSEEIVRKFVASGTPDSTKPTTGWKVLDNDGISVRFDERGRLQIALNSPKGFVYQVTSWRPRTAEMLSDWLSKQDWEAIRKRALEVDARAFDGPDPILNPPQPKSTYTPGGPEEATPATCPMCGTDVRDMPQVGALTTLGWVNDSERGTMTCPCDWHKAAESRGPAPDERAEEAIRALKFVRGKIAQWKDEAAAGPSDAWGGLVLWIDSTLFGLASRGTQAARTNSQKDETNETTGK